MLIGYRGLHHALYSLEKLIEWKHTQQALLLIDLPLSLYSLEKLIEWKPTSSLASDSEGGNLTLYSLEKLIEWKLPSLVGLIHESTLLSLYSHLEIN